MLKKSLAKIREAFNNFIEDRLKYEYINMSMKQELVNKQIEWLKIKQELLNDRKKK